MPGGKTKTRAIKDSVVEDAIAMVAEGRLPEKRKPGRPSKEQAETIVDAQEKFLKTKWTKFIALLQEGALVQDALSLCDFPKYALQGIIKTNQELMVQYEEAKVMGLWHGLDIETVEDIMVDISSGESLKAACENRLISFEMITKLALKDPFVAGMYDDAQQMRMENMSYEILEISDDESNDMGRDAKGGDRPNSAAVQRARLKSDNRKWLMARLNHRKFGDRIKQDVEQNVIVNHVEKLDAARRRKEKLNAARAETA